MPGTSGMDAASNQMRTDEQTASGCDGAAEDAAVEDLVRRAQAGDMAAFDGLVRRFSGPMYNLAYRMVGNGADADDLAQEIFVKLHRSIGQFRWQARFTTWLYAVAANVCRSGMRRRRRISSREVMSLDRDDSAESKPPVPADPGDPPAQAIIRRETREQVETAIAELPEEFRMTIVLRDLQGLEYEEIAQALKCSMGTVKSRLARARLRVKERLVRQGVVVGNG
jgi:RNA polymerase sigma-70 factor, ECF subfamily